MTIVKQTINAPLSKLSSRKQNTWAQETCLLSICSSIQNNVRHIIVNNYIHIKWWTGERENRKTGGREKGKKKSISFRVLGQVHFFFLECSIQSRILSTFTCYLLNGKIS